MSNVIDGQVINFHYITDLLGEYQSKLLYNIFTKGIVNRDYENYIDVNFEEKTITIKKGLSLFAEITVPQQTATHPDYDKVLIKVDIVSDKTYEMETGFEFYLVYRFEWEWEEEQSGQFLQVAAGDLLTDDVIIAKVNPSTETIDWNVINLAGFSNELDIPLNADYLNGYDTDIEGGLAVNNGTLQTGLNAYMITGKTIDELAMKNGVLQTNLNAEYLWDGNEKRKPCNEANCFALANGQINTNLNADMLNGLHASGYSDLIHTHLLDNILDGVNYRKVLGVQNGLVTDDSFVENAFTMNKVAYSGTTKNTSTFRPNKLKLIIAYVPVSSGVMYFSLCWNNDCSPVFSTTDTYQNTFVFIQALNVPDGYVITGHVVGVDATGQPTTDGTGYSRGLHFAGLRFIYQSGNHLVYQNSAPTSNYGLYILVAGY